jgi:iron complex transport system ATP-binding protein
MLEFRNVNVTCDRRLILENISVSFNKGEITTIVGTNGCGKTTLLQCLNGVSKLKSGAIYLDGEDFMSLSSRERATRLSFMPQVRNVIPTLPVKTLVEHGRFPYLGFTRRKSAKDIEIVNKAMEFTHIDKYASEYTDTLSGGIRQRVFFAMVLAQDCDYIVLDEPTTYLDLKGQREFLDMAAKLKEQGRTVILVLHDLGQALSISDRIVVMKDLRIVMTGTPKECLESGVLEKVFETRVKVFFDSEGEYYFFDKLPQ